MKRKHIDAAREARLWIGQIIVPTLTLLSTTMAIPEVRRAVTVKVQKLKFKFANKFKKK